MPRTPTSLLLAVLFTGSGLLTYQIYYLVAKSAGDDHQLVLQLLTGLPFALAAGLRFMRLSKWIVPAVSLGCIAWVTAFRLALALGGNWNPYLGMAIAGMVGAIGVTVATGLGCRSLFRRQTLLGAGLIGAVAGIPFGLVFNRSPLENVILAISFPLWQVAVGLWLGSRLTL